MTKGELDRDLAYYEAHRAEFLERHKGLFVLIKGDALVGVYPSAEAAYSAGLGKFDLQPFLVKQVLETEPIGYIPTYYVVVPNARL